MREHRVTRNAPGFRQAIRPWPNALRPSTRHQLSGSDTRTSDSGSILSSLGLLVGMTSAVFAGQDIRPADRDFFESRIRPVLVEHCYPCHSQDADAIHGELLLDSRAAIAAGGENGPVIDLDNPESSRLLAALGYQDEDIQMPPDGALSKRVVEDFQRWIQMGAPDPRAGKAITPMDAILRRAENHWAFQPPQSPQLPVVDDAANLRQPLDHFVYSYFADHQQSPDPPTDPATLLRRIYHDLTGLVPDYEQVVAFQADPSDAAYSAMVDRLLDSPQFGERWARHWLDLARYSDTKGYVFTEKRDYANAYRYRDWVIEAFQSDMPFDQFLTLQIAADQLIDGKSEAQRPSLAAMGYLTLGRRFVKNKHDIINDRIDVVFRGMMGLTVSCARCHDHKYDPITTAEYYGIYGVFDSSKEEVPEDLPPHLVEGHPHDVQVFRRGNHGDRGDVAPRQFLTFFSQERTPQPFEKGSGRLELAQSIASRDNPLTARVHVNRVWAHLFGQPLVRTASDFGLRGELPEDQRLRDLLDYLAVDFMENQWSTKRLIRQIVLSSAYRQSARPAGESPIGSLMVRRRRDFESMRDALLQVAGVLDTTVGGPSVPIETAPSSHRRTIYARIERQNLPGIFRTFDFANPDQHAPQRLATTVPQQALFFMNSPFLGEMAVAAAGQARTDDPMASIRAIYRRLFQREPTQHELEMGKRFLEGSQQVVAARNPWHFGYGSMDEQGHVTFHPFAHFMNKQWQRGNRFPDEKYGHGSLRADGGHPGIDYPVIRRWRAPDAGSLRISGQLKHPNDQGDGILAWIVSDQQGILGKWAVKDGTTVTNMAPTHVAAGESIDLVVDPGATDAYDSFHWTARLKLQRRIADNGANRLHTETWSTEEDFHGPLPQPMTRWESYVQALMSTNEFLFVD